MTDIVERLRQKRVDAPFWSDPILSEAADEIERLRAFVSDQAEHGLRFDLNPTVDSREGGVAYTRYLARIDQAVRENAARQLPSNSHHEGDPK